jgi:membrane-associated protease RseP (regulator of RpoE activity)
MKCRDFKNEFEDRAALSETATLHLDSCGDCKKFHFEQTRLWEMLGGLNRVEAPKDFDFQLKAKIARAKPGDYQQTGFFPALRYVLPLSAVLVLLSIFALSGLYFVGNNSVPSVAVTETPNPSVNTALRENSFVDPNEVANINPSPIEELPVNNSAIKQPEIPNKKPEVAQSNKEGGSKDFSDEKPKLITPKEKDTGTISRDIAGTNPKVWTPQGINPNQKPETIVNPNVATTDLNGLLEITGIKTESAKVISVGKNSLAERSGVRVGDVIEAINGKEVIGDSLKVKTSDVKTLIVLRNGERKEIVLQIN